MDKSRKLSSLLLSSSLLAAALGSDARVYEPAIRRKGVAAPVPKIPNTVIANAATRRALRQLQHKQRTDLKAAQAAADTQVWNDKVEAAKRAKKEAKNAHGIKQL